jgi:hypothetical protein
MLPALHLPYGRQLNNHPSKNASEAFGEALCNTRKVETIFSLVTAQTLLSRSASQLDSQICQALLLGLTYLSTAWGTPTSTRMSTEPGCVPMELLFSMRAVPFSPTRVP